MVKKTIINYDKVISNNEEALYSHFGKSSHIVSYQTNVYFRIQILITQLLLNKTLGRAKPFEVLLWVNQKIPGEPEKRANPLSFLLTLVLRKIIPYLYGGDGSLLGGSDPLLHASHVGGEGWLVTHSGGDTPEEGRHLRTGLGKHGTLKNGR